MERVTDPAAEMTDSKNKKKDPRKVAAGRAGAAARKAKQERLLEELRAAKEQQHQPGISPPISEREEPVSEAPAGQGPVRAMGNWTPWIIGAAGLAGIVYFCAGAPQPRVSRVLELSPGDCIPKPVAKPPPCAKQLKLSTDPFYME